MEKNNIYEMEKNFKQQAGEVGKIITKLLEAVNDGRILPEEDMKRFETEVSALNEKYSIIYEAAKTLTGEKELPPYGSSAKELTEAVKNSRVRELENMLLKAKNILESFTAVKSLISNYSEALLPYQKKAAELLAGLTTENVEELYKETEAPDIFLRAMKVSENNYSEFDELTEYIHKNYSRTVYNGVLRGKYFIDEAYITAEGENGHEEEIISSADAETPVKAAAEEALIESEAPAEAAAAGEEKNEKTNRIEKAPEMLKAVNKPKTGTPSAASFKKTIMKAADTRKEIRVILPLMTQTGVLTRKQIYGFGVCLGFFEDSDSIKERVNSAIDYLTASGFLGCFRYEAEEAYCLSSYCLGCIKKDTISVQMKSFWALKFGGCQISCKNEIDKAVIERTASNSDSLLKCYTTEKRILSEKEFNELDSSLRWVKDHHQICIKKDENKYICRLANKFDDVSEMADENILIVDDGSGLPSVFGEACINVFVLKDDNIYECKPGADLAAQITEAAAASAESEASDKSEESKKLSEDTGEAEAAVKEKEPEEENEEITEIEEYEDINESLKEAFEAPKEEKEEEAEAVSAEETKAGETIEEAAEEAAESPEEAEAVEEKTFEAQEAASVLTPEQLLNLGRTPADSEFCGTIISMLNKKPSDKEELTSGIVNAVLLAKGAGLEKDRPESKKLSAQLRLASNLMTDDGGYTSENLLNTFSDEWDERRALMLSAYLFAMLTPSEPYDFGLKSKTEGLLSDFDNKFKGLSAFKGLFNKLREVKAEGFTPAVIASLGNNAEKEESLKPIKNEAKAFMDLKTSKQRIKWLPKFYDYCFGKGSDLYRCMSIIAEGKNSRDDCETVEIALMEFCSCDSGVYKIKNDRIDEDIDRCWKKANPNSRMPFKHIARHQAFNKYVSIIDIMIKWIDHIKSYSVDENVLENLKKLRNEILSSVSEIQNDNSWRDCPCCDILEWTLYYMEEYLNGKTSWLLIYSDLLKTGVFSLGDDDTPYIDESLSEIKYYELWRNALKHITSKRRSFEEIEAEILGDDIENDGDDSLKDNLNQLTKIRRLLNQKENGYISKEQREEAVISAEDKTGSFKAELEFAYTCGHINETQKETLLGVLNSYEQSFYESEDFASWRRFLEALRLIKDDYREAARKKLEASLAAGMEKDGEAPILKDIKRLIEDELNFKVADDYISIFESGKREIDKSVLPDKDYFKDFLSPENYNVIYEVCEKGKGRTVNQFGTAFVKDKFSSLKWTEHSRINSLELVSSWPKRKNEKNELATQRVCNLFTGLGFKSAKSAEKDSTKTEEVYKLRIEPSARNLSDYPHPIAAFGTQIKNPVNAVFLYGKLEAKDIVDRIIKLDLSGISVVFIDYFIDISTRRQIVEIFHKTSRQKPFLLIDQILFLYLALHSENERLQALLMCTLPFTSYQPFIRDGGPTADEMFCGRIRELNSIIDPNGACVVYGGRQLGKTALLERAESLCSRPEEKAFAVKSSISNCRSEEETVNRLTEDINWKTDGKIALSPCKTLEDMCRQLKQLFKEKKIKSMHLLIDEVDNFLASIADEAYAPIQPLIDLKRETKNAFKFVITGLHNVCRAKNATKNNGIFGQLGTPLCIKPLSPADAQQLLSRPLRYLGFQIDENMQLNTILSTTNYYPGILQFVGYILVENFTTNYGRYYNAAKGNPPFTLDKEQLSEIINSTDLNRSIKEKFRLSLELDPRYFMLARCITVLYHLNEEDSSSRSWLGFSTEDIISIAKDFYEIKCLKNETETDIITLLDEMVEMGILSRPEENLYRLRMSSFIDIIGENLDDLDKEIKKNNMEEQL